MSGKTVKLNGWMPQPRPDPESDDTKFHRMMIIRIVFGLYHQKKQLLAEKGMPPQPISLREIWKEFQSRREMLVSIKEWPFPWHTKRWLDRRINECASMELLKIQPELYENGKPKIVSSSAGLYEPSPQLFK